MRQAVRQEAIQRFEHDWPSKILDYTRTHLQEDALALRVFDLLRAGNSPAEIRELLNIKVEVYNAARKTISCRMNDLFARWRAIAKQDAPSSHEEDSDHA
jgi:hypothetical protein